MTIRLSPLLGELIAELERIPGLGPRSAQRAAMHLLREGRVPALRALLDKVDANLHRCPLCNTFTEKEICDVCADETRSPVHLCVVESVGDQMALDASLSWGGQYYVLDGRLNPIEGRGPEAIGMADSSSAFARPRRTEKRFKKLSSRPLTRPKGMRRPII